MTTFTQVLDQLLRSNPGRPLITYYDFTTGERTELSLTTYANWVAKAGSLLADECDLERGQRLLIDLPTHWLGPVFVGAAWTVGLEVVWPGSEDEVAPDGIVCGPDGVDHYADLAGDIPVLASALLPMGARFSEPLPADVLDIGVQIWGQPDAFTAWDPPTGEDLAAPGLTQGQLWPTITTVSPARGDRLLSEWNPASGSGLSTFTSTLASSGSMVLAVGADEKQRQAVATDERVTARADG